MEIKTSASSPGLGKPLRKRSKSVTWFRGSSRRRSRAVKNRNHAPERDSIAHDVSNIEKNESNFTEPVSPISNVDQRRLEKGKQALASELTLIESTVTPAVEDVDGFTKVVTKKQKKKINTSLPVPNGKETKKQQLKKFLQDLVADSSCDNASSQSGRSNAEERKDGKAKMGQQPKIASVLQ